MGIRDGRFDLGNGLMVDAGLTEKALRKARADAIPLVRNGPWRSWRMGATLAGRQIVADVYFHHGRLWQLHLALADEPCGEGEWPDMDALGAAHDTLLERLLGRPPYRFGWGSIESTRDPRSFSAFIIASFGPSHFG